VLDAWNRGCRRLPRSLAHPLEIVARVPTETPDLGRTGPFLFVSDLTRQRARTYATWSMDDTAVVHSGVDRRTFTPPAALDPAREWRGRLLYAGRYDPRKGIETAVRALVHLPDAVLEIRATGDPAEQTRLEGVVAELGLGDRVEMGACGRDELAARYWAADLVLFPSEWEEPFGLVPLEAMACGTPVAGTGVGGSGAFLLDGVNCVRFTAGDPAGLAGAVQRVADDPGLRATLVTNGLRTAEFFDVDHLADTFEAWHTAATDRFAHGRPAERVFAIDEARDG
jgi:glycosyltransferase involved in cell wall biosynthesis